MGASRSLCSRLLAPTEGPKHAICNRVDAYNDNVDRTTFMPTNEMIKNKNTSSSFRTFVYVASRKSVNEKSVFITFEKPCAPKDDNNGIVLVQY